MYVDTIGELTRKATRLVRREDMRLLLAHIFRATVHSLPPDHLLFHRGVAHHYSHFLAVSLQVRMPAFARLFLLLVSFFLMFSGSTFQ